MYRNYIIIYLFAFVTANEKKSFTIVLDTTKSMRDEIDILKTGIGSVVNANLSDIESYILVPFNDPEFGPAITLSTPGELVNIMSLVMVGGGNDCPESSMPAIELALKYSKSNSFIFVFTDGYAQDYNKLSTIENLCRNSQSQVIIILSDKCVPTERNASIGTIDVYFDVAKLCSGSVLQFELNDFRQVFKFMKEFTKNDWNEVSIHKVFIGPKQFTFTIDSHTKELIVVVSGAYPTLEITDKYGHRPAIEKIINTRQSQVIRMIQPNIGEYTAEILCQGPTVTTFYKSKELQFQYGFSPKLPRSMKETSRLPLPDSTSYICFAVAEISIELNSVDVIFDGRKVKKINIEIVDQSKGLYAAKEYFESGKSFKITIYGRDASRLVIKGTTGTLKPQRNVLMPGLKKPRIEMIEPEVALVEYNTNFTIACKVSGFPKPIISWYDDAGTTFDSEDALLETSPVFISYATVEKVTKNSTVYCKGENSEGQDSLTMELSVNRTFSFDVKQYPQDATFEYGSEGQLYCEVDAYPEASVKWYHNDSLVIDSNDLEIIPAENKLLIKNMSLENSGEYKCETSNSVESKSYVAVVDISGLEAPEVELESLELVLEPGNWVNTKCTVKKGKPTPVINWKFKTEYDFTDIPEGVSAEYDSLKIPSVKTDHMGVYRCEAVNIVGSDSREVVVKVQYAPKIKIDEEVKVVKEDETVELVCEVDGMPKPRVRWELTQDDVMVALDSRHQTNEWNTHKFTALSRDSGNYRCIAENTVGSSERTIRVNVQVEPYIEAPPYSEIKVRPRSNLTLPCTIKVGNPVPTTKWEFIALNGTTTTLLRGTSTSPLTLRNISKIYEGSYICVAENEAGSDTIKIIIKVF